MITRRRFLAAAGGTGALGLLPPGARAAGAAGADRARPPAVAPAVLRIVQGPPGTPQAGPDGDGLLWRLGAHEWLDPRRLHARLARWPGARIEATVDGGNHLLLVDALRAHGGVVARDRWSPATQRWTVVARIGAPAPRPANTTGTMGAHDDRIA
ncbi:MAG: hypothetical protein U1F06_02750 [Steroidobacteraceae bacterium]